MSSPREDITKQDAPAQGTPKQDTPEQDASEQDTKGQANEELEEGEVRKIDLHQWYKCQCDPAQYGGLTAYWTNRETNESRWTEPDEPYWIWDAVNQTHDAQKGLQQPASKTGVAKVDPGTFIIDNIVYERYNPKIHGDYDATKPYAKYHEMLREKEKAEAAASAQASGGMTHDEHYAAMATFNRRTGAFQNADQTAEQHSDHAKAKRQMGAYFDVDAAANAHNGQSLKDQRRQQKHSKKEIQEMAQRRKDKKHAKRMAWLRD